MNIEKKFLKLKKEISFFEAIIFDESLVINNWFRVQRFYILYNQVFENYLGQIRYEILTKEELLAVNFQEFKTTFIYRSFYNLGLFNFPRVLLDSYARDLLLVIWLIGEKRKPSSQTSSFYFFKNKIADLSSFENLMIDLNKCSNLDNIIEIKSQFENIIEKYNVYLLNGIQLWYVRGEILLVLFSLKSWSQVQFSFLFYLFSFDDNLFQYFTCLNSTWADIHNVYGRLLSLQTFNKIEKNSNVFLSKLNRLIVEQKLDKFFSDLE